MNWWNDFLNWVNSTAGGHLISAVILPFVAIIVAALLAAWIGRASARRVLAHQDRELKSAAIMALIGSGRKAAVWNSLGTDERQHIDSLISEADIRVRLLPVNGANAAADWATHELNGMKKNSATFSYQADQTFIDYRDRLLEWQDKPGRARKLFAYDLEQWRYDDDSADKSVVEKQQEWATAHAETPASATAATSTAAGSPLEPSTTTLLAAAPPPDVESRMADPVTAPVSHDAFKPRANTRAADAAPPATGPVATSTGSIPTTTGAIDTSTGAIPTSTGAIPTTTGAVDTLTGAVPTTTGAVVTASVDTGSVATHDSSSRVDSDGVPLDESENPYAPPVTAGTVRARIAPDTSRDDR
jgi:hypothetical protein